MNAKINKPGKGINPFALVWVISFIFTFLLSTPATAQLYDWTKLDPAEVPSGRDDHMMAFDSDKGLVIMFGGDLGGNSTWAFDGKNWQDLGISDKPAPRREAAMVYDSKRKMIVMYGGWDYAMDSSLTWQFDGEKWFARAEEDDPVGRSDHAMAFDEARGVSVMYGGDDVTAETWTFDGENWVIAKSAADGPGLRWGHAMAYDSKREVVVMFGGFTDQHMNDTWEWDGTDWAKIETPQSPPVSRDHAMVFDSSRNVIVMFGGRENFNTGYDRTWEYDGNNWIQRGPTASSPDARHEVAAAFDSWRNKVVIFGGSTGDLQDNRYKNDTWWYPNVPPVIFHSPEISVSPNNNLAVVADVEDVDNDDIEVRLFYKMSDSADFDSLVMNFTNNEKFRASIPASALSEGKLQYYIRASDPEGSGTFGFGASATKPFEVIVAQYGSIKVKMGTKVARKRGARWTILGKDDGWHKSAFVLKDVTPGTHQIKFEKVEGFKKPGIKTIEVKRGFETLLEADYVKIK